jgi:hypothetical protein
MVMRRTLSIAVVLAALPVLLLPGSRVERAVAEPAPAPREKISPVVKKLMEERVDMLKRALKGSLERRKFDPNAPGIEASLKIARQLRKAELSLAERPAGRRAAHLAYFKLLCRMDDATIGLYETGGFVSPVDVFVMRAARLAAEIDLRQAGGTPPEDVKPAREIKDPQKLKKRGG